MRYKTQRKFDYCVSRSGPVIEIDKPSHATEFVNVSQHQSKKTHEDNLVLYLLVCSAAAAPEQA